MQLSPAQRATLGKTLLAKAPPPDRTYLRNDPASIRQFQRFQGLVADGIVGPKTRAKMQQVNTTMGSPPPRRAGGGASRPAPKPASRRPAEDEDGFNPQTMGNKRGSTVPYYSKGKGRPD